MSRVRNAAINIKISDVQKLSIGKKSPVSRILHIVQPSAIKAYNFCLQKFSVGKESPVSRILRNLVPSII